MTEHINEAPRPNFRFGFDEIQNGIIAVELNHVPFNIYENFVRIFFAGTVWEALRARALPMLKDCPGKDVHSYSESSENKLGFYFDSIPFDDENVSLDLSNVKFKASNTSVTIFVPVGFLEKVLQKEVLDFSLINVTDVDMARIVKENMARHDEMMAKFSSVSSQSSLAGLFATKKGDRELSIEEQVSEGIESLKCDRSRQIRLRAEVDALIKEHE